MWVKVDRVNDFNSQSMRSEIIYGGYDIRKERIFKISEIRDLIRLRVVTEKRDVILNGGWELRILQREW